MLKKILIENLTCSASVGVYENEKLNKQKLVINLEILLINNCLLYTSPSPRDKSSSRMPSSA